MPSLQDGLTVCQSSGNLSEAMEVGHLSDWIVPSQRMQCSRRDLRFFVRNMLETKVMFPAQNHAKLCVLVWHQFQVAPHPVIIDGAGKGRDLESQLRVDQGWQNGTAVSLHGLVSAFQHDDLVRRKRLAVLDELQRIFREEEWGTALLTSCNQEGLCSCCILLQLGAQVGQHGTFGKAGLAVQCRR